MPRLDFRPAQVTASDARLAADIATRARPDEPEDAVVLHHFWDHPPPGHRIERYFVLEAGAVVGTARIFHPLEVKADTHARISAVLVPEARSAQRQAEVLDFIEGRNAGTGIRLLAAMSQVDQTDVTDALEMRGWQRDRQSQAWNLDLVRNRSTLLALAAECSRRLRAVGVSCVPLAAETDPARYEKLYRLANAAERDIPTTLPIREAGKEEFMNNMAAPNIREDRFWLAKIGDDYVGLSFLTFPPERGNVWTGFTAVAREHRGKGIARGVKMETLAQAIEMGVPRVRTDNDQENAPMLHINETLGYEPIPAFQGWLKRL